MAERIGRREFVRRLAERMQADEATAAARLDGMVEEMDLTHRDYRGPAGTWEAAVRASLSQDEKIGVRGEPAGNGCTTLVREAPMAHGFDRLADGTSAMFGCPASCVIGADLCRISA